MNRELALFAEIYPLLHNKKSPAKAEQELDNHIIPQSEAIAYEDENQMRLEI